MCLIAYEILTMCLGIREREQMMALGKKGQYFFELPYWQHNSLRHNLDIMHIEKNIVDNVIGTILDIPGKTKDHANARYDLKKMGIRKNLQPKETNDGKRTKFAKGCFSMINGEKSVFCDVLKTEKLPDGSASNISREYEVEVSNQRRGSKWSKAKKYSQNFSQWFETRSLKEDLPDLIKQLSFGPNLIAKRYSGYLINGYKFHTRQRDARRKTQNSGVTLVAQTTSFASSKDKNPVEANLTYYGRIVDIVELDYYGHFRVVLFKCDWYEVEEDIYGLTYVYFNKKCYQNEPFVPASQVHQCFYMQDPYDQDRYYVMKTIPRDLFSLSGELASNAPQCYENEPSEYLVGPSIPVDNGEVALVRSDVPTTILDVPPEGFLSQQLEVESDEEFDFEDTSSVFFLIQVENSFAIFLLIARNTLKTVALVLN
uniref:Uncharacterized protein LOC104232894 isoform X2 n=1 Tax=Nicotiana sylvestris TaxID=4096 RepID=A0A1U7X0Y1_NICSY|nr:PREDICTED: uncharacterized protein LOC104232894 isoform X2 [Nicotiana sylvestris]